MQSCQASYLFWGSVKCGANKLSVVRMVNASARQQNSIILVISVPDVKLWKLTSLWHYPRCTWLHFLLRNTDGTFLLPRMYILYILYLSAEPNWTCDELTSRQTCTSLPSPEFAHSSHTESHSCSHEKKQTCCLFLFVAQLSFGGSVNTNVGLSKTLTNTEWPSTWNLEQSQDKCYWLFSVGPPAGQGCHSLWNIHKHYLQMTHPTDCAPSHIFLGLIVRLTFQWVLIFGLD